MGTAEKSDREVLAHLLGARIAELREERGYSQELLAGLARISFAGLRKIELGERIPGFDTAKRLAFVFGSRAASCGRRRRRRC